jgi:sugar lactone lactonase YvrE
MNHRIIEWKQGDSIGRVLAGEIDEENQCDQLSTPTDVIVDKEINSIIVCDRRSGRVTRWSRHGQTRTGETIIDNIACGGVAMNNERDIYVSNTEKHEVRRYRIGGTTGVVVAGGRGRGVGLNQLNAPGSVHVDRNGAVYVSDWGNHRVMKWVKNAKIGVVVAGGQGEGDNVSQLSHPHGVFVDAAGVIYVVDSWNDRVMRWSRGATQGTIVVGGNGVGEGPNQLNRPSDLTFDRSGNLYVADCGNHRIQRFSIELN